MPGSHCMSEYISVRYFFLCFNNLKTRIVMIIMPIKEGENIERALKKFKRKYEKTGVIKELRSRQYFTKPSVKNRVQKLKAIYVQGLQREEE